MHGRSHLELDHPHGIEEFIVAIGLDQERTSLLQGAGDGPNPAMLNGACGLRKEPIMGEKIRKHDVCRPEMTRQ